MKTSAEDLKPLRAAVIGVGNLGQHHARVYTQLPGIVLVGVVDANLHRAKEVAKKNHCQAFADFGELLGLVDLVSIVVPTAHHFDIAREFLQQGVAVMLEKPMTRTVEEADELIRLSRERGVPLQIGHIERFNEAIQELKRVLKGPRFIEVHRLGPYSQRNTDIGVVLDLMIHDLDIIMDLADSPVERVEAVGVKILSEHEDIANARITLASGCVANVTASRVTVDAKRKIRIFSPESYISIDYQKQELYIYKLKKDLPLDENNLMRMIKRERRVFGRKEPLLAELDSFVTAVREGREPEVTGEAGRRALAVALEISGQIRAQKYAAV
ncbi:Gfo/Idh/MocA family oxidoreductase [bacterium]|nr:Gfo/Idh/MocA family oxidoreductase [bacterium]